ncbi:EVE domain-containing protein [Scopulibacillus darangshiensis]|uniref:EVE domain-containing protein n=1 Tax=Scopulibacillus darangshiensis TaxID=442528 RepID=UPI001404F242|nr:EVE domain-containing protein [Scopulibacillus darangshiensis]
MAKQQFWFMVASDTAAAFRWEHILESQRSQFWWLRRLPKNFKSARVGDLILCYRSGSDKRALVGLAKVEEGFNEDGIMVKGLLAFKHPIPFERFKHEPVYKKTEAGRLRNRGTLFAVDSYFVNWVREVLEVCGDQEAADMISSRFNNDPVL